MQPSLPAAQQWRCKQHVLVVSIAGPVLAPLTVKVVLAAVLAVSMVVVSPRPKLKGVLLLSIKPYGTCAKQTLVSRRTKLQLL